MTLLSNSGIVSGQIIHSSQVLQIVNALTGKDQYDIMVSGSIQISGSGSFLGTASRSITASWADNAESASYALTASYVLGGSGGPPGGAEGSIQYNSGSAFGGGVDFLYTPGDGVLIGTGGLVKSQSLFIGYGKDYGGGYYEGTATGSFSFAQGQYCGAVGNFSHAQGLSSLSIGDYSHAEGSGISLGDDSHAEGQGYAQGNYSHAEGLGISFGDYSHAEGYNSVSSGSYSHAEGLGISFGEGSHAEGYNSVSSGSYSHAEGRNTLAINDSQHTSGLFNSSSYSDEIFSVGNGGPGNLSTAFFVSLSGSIMVQTGSLSPSWEGREGEMKPVYESGTCYLYVYIRGSWKKTILA